MDCMQVHDIEKKKLKGTLKNVEKVFTISIDNATANDSCIHIMKDTIVRSRKLPCGGKLFHARCVAHMWLTFYTLWFSIGLQEIKNVIENIHDSVDYITGSEARMKLFAEIAQELQIPHRKLVHKCKTRWNSTYEMLTTPIKFKDIFPRYAERDPSYEYLPHNEVFKSATNIISRLEYPTSNLFLSYVSAIKEMLDKHQYSSDEFICSLVRNMKDKFDKYWCKCNLLMSMAIVLDPRLEMGPIEFTFRCLYPPHEVRDDLYELHAKYTSEIGSCTEDIGESESRSCVKNDMIDPMSSLRQQASTQKVVQRRKLDLELYFELGSYTMTPTYALSFDILSWWKQRQEKYGVYVKWPLTFLYH
ncbi:hypothetical protein Cgig2_025348 [Carnegiea gigantea]|uniref:hAT-like transposase RNase-H fold domain-containing protein n=1 Tax=Carnegiea gigantea TaxID=171969 RepID=A0A9Q1JS08_9CARY|nr:hypothetical protein Cgig2_025348 [Carnegiea gigantea]